MRKPLYIVIMSRIPAKSAINNLDDPRETLEASFSYEADIKKKSISCPFRGELKRILVKLNNPII